MSGRPRKDVKPGGLRAALALKKVRTGFHPIPIAESSKVDQINGRLETARQNALRASWGDDQAEKDRTQAEADKIKAELDSCFWFLQLRALPGDDDLDALLNEHPATDEQIEKAKAENEKTKAEGGKPGPLPTTNLDEFNVAFLVACAVDSDLTADEWRAELWSDKWTPADRISLFNRVNQTNTRDFSAGISFG